MCLIGEREKMDVSIRIEREKMDEYFNKREKMVESIDWREEVSEK